MDKNLESALESLDKVLQKLNEYSEKGYKESFENLSMALRTSVRSMKISLTKAQNTQYERVIQSSVMDRAGELKFFFETLLG